MSNHIYEHYLEFALSVQERKVTVHIARMLVSESDKFDVKDVRDKVDIEQHSHFSAIITRLVHKGVLTRLKRGQYEFSDFGLIEYVRNNYDL